MERTSRKPYWYAFHEGSIGRLVTGYLRSLKEVAQGEDNQEGGQANHRLHGLGLKLAAFVIWVLVIVLGCFEGAF